MIDISALSLKERVIYCRKLLGYNQTQLAELMGMKPSTYSNMERSGNFSAIKLIEIAKTLGISSNLLFNGVEEDAPVKIISNTQNEKTDDLKQVAEEINIQPIMYTKNEDRYFRIVHNLPKKYKEEVFEFIQEKYHESKHKKSN